MRIHEEKETKFFQKNTKVFKEITNHTGCFLPISKNLKVIKQVPPPNFCNKIAPLMKINERTPIKTIEICPCNFELSSSSSSSSNEEFDSLLKMQLKRSSKEVGRESYSYIRRWMPMGYLSLENEDHSIYKCPYYRDSDCGFGWKLSIKIHECSSDDDHKTPTEITQCAAKESFDDLRMALKSLKRKGLNKFHKDISCYRKFQLNNA